MLTPRALLHAGVAAAAACGGAAACRAPVRAAPPPATWPQCFEIARRQPHNPAGDVTHFRADYRGDQLVIDNLHVHEDGQILTSHTELAVTGDHLETELLGAPLEGTLLGPTGSPSGWTLTFRQGDWQFDERIEIGGDGMRLTSTDVGAAGPVVSRFDYVRAPCERVEEAIAAARRAR